MLLCILLGPSGPWPSAMNHQGTMRPQLPIKNLALWPALNPVISRYLSRKNGRFLNCIWIGTEGTSKWHEQAALTPMSPASVVPLTSPQLNTVSLVVGREGVMTHWHRRKNLGDCSQMDKFSMLLDPSALQPHQGAPTGWWEEKSCLQEELQQYIDDLIYMGAEIIWDMSYTQMAGRGKWLGWVAKGPRNKTERWELRTLRDEAFVSMKVGMVCKIFVSHVNPYQRAFTTEDNPVV